MEERGLPPSGQPYRPSEMAIDMTQLYQELMELATINPDMAATRMTGIVDFWLSQEELPRGVTPVKAHRWKQNIQQAVETGNWAGIRGDPGAAIQTVISNILLGLQGLGVKQYGPRESIQMRINTMGNVVEYVLDPTAMNMITEATRHGFEIVVLTEKTKKCKGCGCVMDDDSTGDYCAGPCAEKAAEEDEAKDHDVKK